MAASRWGSGREIKTDLRLFSNKAPALPLAAVADSAMSPAIPNIKLTIPSRRLRSESLRGSLPRLTRNVGLHRTPSAEQGSLPHEHTEPEHPRQCLLTVNAFDD